MYCDGPVPAEIKIYFIRTPAVGDLSKLIICESCKSVREAELKKGSLRRFHYVLLDDYRKSLYQEGTKALNRFFELFESNNRGDQVSSDSLDIEAMQLVLNALNYDVALSPPELIQENI